MHVFFSFSPILDVCMLSPWKSWHFLCSALLPFRLLFVAVWFFISLFFLFVLFSLTDFSFFLHDFTEPSWRFWCVRVRARLCQMLSYYTHIHKKRDIHMALCHLKAFAKEKLHPSFVTFVTKHHFEGVPSIRWDFLNITHALLFLFIENWLLCFSHISLNVMLDYTVFFLLNRWFLDSENNINLEHYYTIDNDFVVLSMFFWKNGQGWHIFMCCCTMVYFVSCGVSHHHCCS